MNRAQTRAAGLALGVVADRLIADPRRFHPVAGFGTVAAALEARWYRPSRAMGVVHNGVLVGAMATTGLVLEHLTRERPGLHVLLTATSTWVVLGGSSLEREGRAVATLLEQDRLPQAREQLTHLVGRDPRGLDADDIARAVVESVAENTSDAVVAPLVLGGLAGVPGLLGYRAANTLDAMVGHRSERYEKFGWASARLDDVLNLPGARLTALLAAVLGPDPRAALGVWRRDAAGHPSPNAGPVEASFAGALGLRLGGTNTYGDRIEHRHVLGSGRSPQPPDVARAIWLARRVDAAAAMERNDWEELTRVAERGEIAPWLAQPAPRWWQAPTIGLLFGLSVLVMMTPPIAPYFAGAGTVLLLLAGIPYRRWVRARRGTDPSGPQPAELRRLQIRLVIGALVLASVLWFLMISLPGWMCAAAGAVLVTAFATWHLRGEAAAIGGLRARLL